MKLVEPPLFTPEAIHRRVIELASRVRNDYASRVGAADLLLVCVLNGAMVFAADLMRALGISASMDFIRARSYRGTRSTGSVEVSYFPEQPIEGRHVLVVEDILDTGRTAAAVLERLRQARPASLALCTMLDKPARREVPIEADYVGFAIEDLFVVGYGLDYEHRGRHLPAIHVLDTADSDKGDTF